MRILSIAGSDSCGSAGIQADLATFFAFGVKGASVITAITAQNSKGVQSVFYLPASTVKEQLESVFSDMRISAVKIGMVGTKEIAAEIMGALRKHKARNVVFDPVMGSQAGGIKLMRGDALAKMKELVRISSVVTPNAQEAERLTGIRIGNIESGRKAALKLSEMGAKNVVIKGIRKGGKICDVMYSGKKFSVFSKKRVAKGTRGGGCCFSSAIAANLALGRGVAEAVKRAEAFIENAIERGEGVGKESVAPLAQIDEAREALGIVEWNRKFTELIPESGMNICSAPSYANNTNDIAGVLGRVRNAKGIPRSFGVVEFGASSHVASALLKAMKFDGSIRGALNMKFSDRAIEGLAKKGFRVGCYDRRSEPAGIKMKEGASVAWGVEKAIRKAREVPDVVYHRGGWGKEPMIIVFGKSAPETVRKALSIFK